MTIVNPHSDEVDGPSLSQRQAADDIVRRDAMLAEQMQTPVGRRYVFEEVLGEWRCLRDCKVVRADGIVDAEATGIAYLENARARRQFARLLDICPFDAARMLVEAAERVTRKKQ